MDTLWRVKRSGVVVTGVWVLWIVFIAGVEGWSGKVHFPTSCGQDVAQSFDQAVEVLHSFWYDESLQQFEKIAASHPTCVMAYWGIAMSSWYPLWPAPTESDMWRGRNALATARRIIRENGIPSTREEAYIDAAEQFFSRPDATYNERVAAYEAKMKQLYLSFQDTDIEASVFYALAVNAKLLTFPLSATQDIINLRKKAGKILELVLIDHPDHPGALHYLIHSYDDVTLATQALEAAHKYSVIAPEVPHALHMPSHTFVDLGLWEPSMASNRRTMAVALAHDRKFYKNITDVMKKDPLTEEYAHALAFLTFALQQHAKDDEVRQLLAENVIDKEGKKYAVKDETVANALSSVLMRFAIERNRWEELENYQPLPNYFPWSDYLWTPLFIYYARTTSFLRRGMTDQARAMISQNLQPAWEAWRNSDRYAIATEDWKAPLDFLLLSSYVWLDFLTSPNEAGKLEAIQNITRLAESNMDGIDFDRCWINAWDQVGEMYQILEKHSEAVSAFNESLKLFPNRFRALAAGAKSAYLSEDFKLGTEYFKQLLSLCHPEGIDIGDGKKGDPTCGGDRMDIYQELRKLYMASPSVVKGDVAPLASLTSEMQNWKMHLLITGAVVAAVVMVVALPLVLYFYVRSKQYSRLDLSNPSDTVVQVL